MIAPHESLGNQAKPRHSGDASRSGGATGVPVLGRRAECAISESTFRRAAKFSIHAHEVVINVLSSVPIRSRAPARPTFSIPPMDSVMSRLPFAALFALATSCAGPSGSDAPATGLRENVLTAEQQDALTPDRVIELLREGNQRFVGNELTLRDHSEMVRQSTGAQYPKAIVLSCVDSRVPVEDVFDRGIGDVFVARVAGNFVNEDILGSMEFACAVAGSKLVLVMGHEHCGAVKAAIDGVELGNITTMLTRIQPAVDKARASYSGDTTSKNEEFVHEVCEQNVLDTIAAVRAGSPILADLEIKGEIRIVGAVYDMDTGVVSFLDL